MKAIEVVHKLDAEVMARIEAALADYHEEC